ncbi:Uncharacterised protein [Mycobacteroides abscessus subsp. abscessus]|nr:Uncharacterised protein [Mycobacteroides abscessus subsp. abscessus]
MRPRSDQDGHQHMVIGLAVVAGRLFAHHQRAHAEAGHEVGGTEDE